MHLFNSCIMQPKVQTIVTTHTHYLISIQHTTFPCIVTQKNKETYIYVPVDADFALYMA